MRGCGGNFWWKLHFELVEKREVSPFTEIDGQKGNNFKYDEKLAF